MPWQNTIADSPIQLVKNEVSHLPDVPGPVLGTAPEGTDWWAGSDEHWVATRGTGRDTELFVGGPKGWFEANVRGGAGLVLDANQRCLFCKAGQLWSLKADGARSTLEALAHFEGLSGAAFVGDSIALLIGDNQLVFFDGENVVSSWALGDGTFAGLRGLQGGELLIVGEYATYDGPPYEDHMANIIDLRGDVPRLVARIAPSQDAGEYKRWLSLDVGFVGPYEGPFGNASKAVPLPDDMLSGDGGMLRLTGLDQIEPGTGAELSPASEPVWTTDDLPPAATFEPLNNGGWTPPNPDPTRQGPLLRRLLERMAKYGERNPPDPDIVELLSIPMPPDLYALIHLYAHQHVSSVPFDGIDWFVEKPVRADRMSGEAPVGIQIGNMASGDPYVAQVFDSGMARYTNFDSEGYEYFTSHSLEALLETLASEARAEGEPTIFDDL